jgi:hypothetical protein
MEISWRELADWPDAEEAYSFVVLMLKVRIS